jgi:predicted nuclease of predicted toxin-antitoxin system
VSRLFIELYLDEDVSVIVGDLLRARGFSVTGAREAGKLGSSDAGQLAYAIEHGMTLLTHNRCDFEALAKDYFNRAKMHQGIIIAVRRPPSEIVSRLLKILNSTTQDEIENQLLYI